LLWSNFIQPIPKWSSIHIDVWIADRSKPRRIGDGRVDCRERHNGFPGKSRREPLIPRTGLGPMTHDVLRFLVVNFSERVVCLTVRVQ
jgi:hypothetical protein